jgi:hypothetical protein
VAQFAFSVGHGRRKRNNVRDKFLKDKIGRVGIQSEKAMIWDGWSRGSANSQSKRGKRENLQTRNLTQERGEEAPVFTEQQLDF